MDPGGLVAEQIGRKEWLIPMTKPLLFWLTGLLILSSDIAHSQQDAPPAHVFHPDQVVEVPNLRARLASSSDVTAILSAALETVIIDPELCCGKDSGLEDVVQSTSPLSLKDLSSKIRGRHLLSGGRSVSVAAEYLAPDSIHPDDIIAPLSKKHALLITWKSQLYILCGATFDETLDYSGQRQYVIHKLLLLDPRFSDQRRESAFNRQGDDWKDVQGILGVSVAALK